jgi:hypothetical protein|tara:strand:+ start:51 stop:224 length:174 start_codon:yes stop_codon:yes gene_type:complete
MEFVLDKYVLIFKGEEIDRTITMSRARGLRREYQLAFKGLVKIEEIKKEDNNYNEKF